MPEDRPQQLLMAARTHLADGNIASTIDVLGPAWPKFPDKPGFLLKAAGILAECGVPEAALASVEAVLAVQPDNWTALLRRFGLACQVADIPRARVALEALDKAGAGKGAAPFLAKAKFLILCGYPEQAIAVERAARQLEPDNLELQLREIDRLIANGEIMVARTQVDALLATHPDNPHLNVKQVPIAYAQQGSEAAIQLARMLTDRFPDFLPGHLQWSQQLEKYGQIEAAGAVLQNAAVRFPGRIQPLVKLSELHLRHSEPEKALESARQARVLTPWAVRAVLAEVNSLVTLAHLEDAYELLKSLVKRERTTPRVFTRLIDLAGKMQDRPAISAFAEQGLRAFPDNPVILEFLVWRSMTGAAPPSTDAIHRLLEGKLPSPRFEKLYTDLMLQNGDNAAALARARQSGPRRTPDHAIGIIRALLGLRRLELALRYSRFCLRCWPNDIRIAQIVATAFSKAGQETQAIALFKAVCSGGRQGETAHDPHLARLCFEAGRLEDALRYYRISRAVKPINHASIAQYIRCLASSGDIESTRRLIADFHAEASRTNKQIRKTFGGQIVEEINLELARDNTAIQCRLAPGDMTGHARLIQDFPRSNIAGMRFMRNWLDADQTGRDTHVGPGNGPDPIPRIIHQYWNDPTPPDAISAMIDSWQGVPGTRHMLWNRQSALARLRSDFGPRWTKAFQMANNPSEEADFLRLCLLAKDGGIYADADDILTGSLDSLSGNGAGLIVYMEPLKSNLGNNFLAARPGHPAMVLAARIARQDLLARSNETTWSKSGPGLLTRAVALYLARQVATGENADVIVLTKAQMVNDLAMHNPARYKRGQNYWQQNPRAMSAEVIGEVLRRTVWSGDQHVAAW